MSSLSKEPPTVLLTGGTSGIGAVLRERLLVEGHRVIVLARGAGRLRPAPGLVALACDLGDPAAVLRAAETALAAHPVIDVLINNAAVQHARPLTDPGSTPAQLIEEATVNLLAPALLAQALLPGMAARRHGVIVNVSSGLAVFPKECGGLYAATKAGLSSFSTSLRWQAEGFGVRVVEVQLPLVATPMTAGRGRAKLPAETAAAAILRALRGGPPVVRVGKARVLPVLQRLAPGLGEQIMRGS
jgi:uncharacterized oxidoreductase